LKEFKLFLKSPFNRSQKKALQLFEILIKFYPEFDSDDLNKEYIYNKLFPGKTYNKNTLRNIIFDLTKSAEDFLIFNALTNDESEYLLNLSKIYLDNNLPSHFMRVTQTLDKVLEPGFSVQKNFISKYKRLSQHKTIYYTETNDFENLIRVKKEYFKQSALNFAMDYIEILGSKKPAQSTHGKPIDSPYINAVEECFDINKFLCIVKGKDPEDPFVILSFCLIKLIQEPEEKANYENLRKEFYKILEEDKIRADIAKSQNRKLRQIRKKTDSNHKSSNHADNAEGDAENNSDTDEKRPSLDREEKHSIFNHLINYCVQQYSLEYMKEALEVHKKLLEFDVYTETDSNYMQVNTYRNIVKICSSVKETDWLEGFIRDYTDKLSPEYRESMQNLATAHLYFLEKNYDESLTVLSKVSENFNLAKTDVRNLRLKIYYELEYIDEAESLADSYYQFLLTSKNVTDDNKNFFSQFLTYYKQLLRKGKEMKSSDLSYMYSQIEKEKNIVNRFWLLEKIGELLEKK
jgi:hypothetical protein